MQRNHAMEPCSPYIGLMEVHWNLAGAIKITLAQNSFLLEKHYWILFDVIRWIEPVGRGSITRRHVLAKVRCTGGYQR